MDDTEPRLPAAGTSVPHRSELHSVTVLADADESKLDALEDWARGLDWVQWLLSGIRQRMEHLHFVAERSETPRTLRREWVGFAESTLTPTLAPHFLKAWQAVHEPDLSALLAMDDALGKELSEEETERSLEAGRLLLKATNRARYQGILGHYRTACEGGMTPGHFLTIWAAVAHFFQLSLANAIAEYLRLEWGMATRHLPVAPELVSLPLLTAQLMRPQAAELRLMA